MEHGDIAQLAALCGAIGAVLVLLAKRWQLLVGGLALLGAAEAAFAYALLGGEDLRRLVDSPAGIGAVAAGGVVTLALAAGFARFPAAAPVVLLAAAPFRLPVDVGAEEAFLLLPLYGVLAAAVLALAYRTLRGVALPPLPPALAIPAAALVALACASLLWSQDLRAGSIALAFFFLPFSALLAVAARSPFAPWLPRALAAVAVALASVFAVIGLWQARTKDLLFAPDLEVANAYTTFFRVTSLFKDPSLYGRQLVVAIAVLVVAVWLGRVRLLLAVPFVALLWAGLYFSYSQSSFVALFVVAVAVPLVLGDRRTRAALAAGAAAFVLVAAVVAVRAVEGESLHDATSARSSLVRVTAEVIRHHPLVGVGIGGQPRASAEEAGSTSVRRNASHTTPLTVAAELGALGIAAYLAVLAGALWILAATTRAERPLGLALTAVFVALVVHSIFYSGFFEDPLTWGILAVGAAALAASPAAARAATVGGRRPKPALATRHGS